MTIEAQIKSVALFFSYAFLDDLLAFKATKAAVKRLDKTPNPSDKAEDAIVRLTFQYWNQLKKQQPEDSQFFSGRLEALESNYTDIGPWREFKKKAEENEFLSVLWAEVLGIEVSNIAKALNLSPGTVKHRIHRGLRILAERVN